VECWSDGVLEEGFRFQCSGRKVAPASRRCDLARRWMEGAAVGVRRLLLDPGDLASPVNKARPERRRAPPPHLPRRRDKPAGGVTLPPPPTLRERPSGPSRSLTRSVRTTLPEPSHRGPHAPREVLPRPSAAGTAGFASFAIFCSKDRPAPGSPKACLSSGHAA
jgi:hypothetical protein